MTVPDGGAAASDSAMGEGTKETHRALLATASWPVPLLLASSPWNVVP